MGGGGGDGHGSLCPSESWDRSRVLSDSAGNDPRDDAHAAPSDSRIGHSRIHTL